MDTLADLSDFIESDPGLSGLHRHVAPKLGDDPGHDVHHALRVALWSVRLAPGVDTREVVAAALAHDLVNLPKNHPDRARASTLSAEACRKLMPRFGFEPDQVERIADAVRDHSYSRGAVPTTDLGRALQDADRLEALGAIGLMRTFSTGARMGARYFHEADPWAHDRPLDDLSFSIDHFFTKLLRLSDTMCTEAGRKEARRRTDIMRAFLDALAQEIGTPMPDVKMTSPAET